MTPEEILGRIVAIPSYSGMENKLADYIKSFIKEHGGGECLDVEGNLILPIKNRAKRAVIFNAHMDTVPAQEGWRTNPFELSEISGRMFGLGASDEKASIAVLLSLLDQFRECPMDVFLTFVKNEEIDGSGTQRVISLLKNMLGTYEDVVCIVCEPTNSSWMEIGNKGYISFDLTATGRSSHASRPEMGENAIEKILLQGKTIESSIRDLCLPLDALGPVTFSFPTMISGGSSRNTVPGTCTASGDIRTNTHSHQQILSLLKAIPGITVVAEVPPFILSGGENIISAFLMAGISNTKTTAGSNDAVFFSQAGIPAIVFGPGNKECIHQPNEYIEKGAMVTAAKVYMDFVRQYADYYADDKSSLP